MLLLSLQPTPFSTSLTLIVPPHVGPLTPKCHAHRPLGYIGVSFCQGATRWHWRPALRLPRFLRGSAELSCRGWYQGGALTLSLEPATLSFRAKTPGDSGLEPWLPFWLGVGTFTHKGMWTKLGAEIVKELSLAALGHRGPV